MRARWDDWMLDVPARRLRRGDDDVHVEPQVFDVLAHLVEHRDRVVSKEELLDSVWGDQFVSESALTTRIKSVRRALGDDGRTQKYVRNVHGRGYQFVGEVGVDRTGGPAPATPSSAPVDADLSLSVAVDDEFPFVGRDAELAAVDSHLAASPGFGLVLVGGEPGVGKSRLAVEILGRATAAGGTVCAGRCDAHVSYALEPLRDAVAQLGAVRPSDLRTWADGVEDQLLALVPALVGQIAGTPREVDGWAAADVLSTVLDRAAATAPVTVLVDDLQWSDEPTRAAISRMSRRPGNPRVRVVCTHRTGATDLPPAVRSWIAEHRRSPSTLVLELDGLPAADSNELIHRVLGDAATAQLDEIVAAAGGNGLFLTEALRDVQRGVAIGSSVHELVAARIERLAADVQDLIRAGAVIDTEFDFELARVAAELDPERALDAVDAAVAAELLHETDSPSRFRFSHQLVRQAVCENQSRAATARIHHRCATALRARDADPVEVAHHLLGGVPLVPLEEAVDDARRAAAGAVEAKEFDRAVRLLEEVLRCDPQARTRAEVQLELGRAMTWAGRADPAAAHFEEAAAVARRNGWTDVLVDAALGHLGQSPYRRLRDTSTLELLAEADAALDAADPHEVSATDRARLLAKTAVFSQFRRPLADCAEMTARALEMAGPDAPPLARLELLESRAIVHSCPAGVAVLDEVDPQIAALRDELDVYFPDAAAPETRLLMIGDGAGLRDVARLDERRVRVQPIAEWRDLSLRGALAAFEGDAQAARDCFEGAGAIGPQFWGDSAYALHALARLFVAHLDGRWGPACDAADLLLAVDANQPVVAAAAWAHVAAGHRERGAEIARMIRIESMRHHGEHIVGGNTLVAIAEVALAIDDDALAAAAEEHLLPFADLVLGVPWAPSLAAADPLARLAARRGDPVASERHRGTARAAYERLGAPALAARLG